MVYDITKGYIIVYALCIYQLMYIIIFEYTYLFYATHISIFFQINYYLFQIIELFY